MNLKSLVRESGLLVERSLSALTLTEAHKNSKELSECCRQTFNELNIKKTFVERSGLFPITGKRQI